MKIFHKLSTAVVSELKNGWSVQGIASSIVIGFALGIFPVLGVTTFLVFGASKFMKLNQVICQIVNYLVYPIQLMLWLPLMLLGANILNIEVAFESLDEFLALFKSNPMTFITEVIWYQLAGVFVWAIFILPLAVALYFFTLVILKKSTETQ